MDIINLFAKARTRHCQIWMSQLALFTAFQVYNQNIADFPL